MSEVVLVRHGETTWSASGQHTGTTDVPLTDHGREQARALAPLLAGRAFALALTSPLQRAAETAALAGLTAELDDDLREWDYGVYEGRTSEQIRAEVPGWTVWSAPVPGGETPAEVGARTDRVLSRVAAVDGDVVLVAHGHVLRVLAARWLGLPPDGGRLLALDTASISVLGWEREERVIRRWNDTTG